jgi:GH24 family phage-related lysozyme (muramidase)
MADRQVSGCEQPLAPKPGITPGQKAGGIAAACVAAAAACLSLTQHSEGERLKPYRDPANIVTWCYGETQGSPKAAYTQSECAALLQGRLASTYAPKIAACLPELADQKRINVFAAFLDASYNAGTAAVCSSPMARAVHSGDWDGACLDFNGWYVTARYRGTPHSAAAMQRAGWHWIAGAWRKTLPGLVTRRAKESQLCRSGL